MALLPDGDTGPSILGDTRGHITSLRSTAPPVDAATSDNHTDIKGN